MKAGRRRTAPELREARRHFGARLRTEREAAGFSQLMLSVVASERVTGVGGRIVIKESLLRCVEVGEMSMPTEFLPVVAEVLGITVARLVGGLVAPERPAAAVPTAPTNTNTTNRRAA